MFLLKSFKVEVFKLLFMKMNGYNKHKDAQRFF